MSEYVSTRDLHEQVSGYSDVLLQGLAPDGGLYMPVDFPTFSTAELQRMVDKPYPELFVEVKKGFIGEDIPLVDQQGFADRAFDHERFPFVVGGNYVPVHEISTNFYIQELSHGPTAAFKDMAMQPLGQELAHVLEVRDQNWLALGATSGDTGPAAEAMVKGQERLALIMLSPREGMSEFQKAQMALLSGGNVFNLSIDAGFRECQDIVKQLKREPEFAHLGAVNSINWARVASQIPYWVSAYLQVVPNIGDPVDFVVPTGNFGNILAGYMARRMGLPIRRLIAATNENTVMHEVIQTGRYAPRQEHLITSSPSMDISEASNFERLVYDLFEQNPEAVLEYMAELKIAGEAQFEEFGLPRTALHELGFDSGSSTHADRLDSIKWVHEQSGRAIDPHTADAVTVARRKAVREVPIVALSTAKPVKFESTIAEAGVPVPARELRFVGIEEDAKEIDGFVELPNSSSAVGEFILKNVDLAA